MNRWNRRFLVWFGAAAIVFGGMLSWWNAGERFRIHEAVTTSARLVAIPDRNYKARTRGNVFTRGYWMAWTCSEEAFDDFVQASPGLRKVTPYLFPCAPDHPVPTTFEQPSETQREAMREAKYFWEVDPGWDDIDASSQLWNSSRNRIRGRRYEITVPEHAIHGYLLRGDESGEVFLYVRFS